MQALLLSPGGSSQSLPIDSSPSRFAFTFSMPSAFSGQRGYEPRFSGYGAPFIGAPEDFNPPEPRAAQRALPVGKDKADRIAGSAPYS